LCEGGREGGRREGGREGGRREGGRDASSDSATVSSDIKFTKFHTITTKNKTTGHSVFRMRCRVVRGLPQISKVSAPVYLPHKVTL
jgi:hypothetical protein